MLHGTVRTRPERIIDSPRCDYTARMPRSIADPASASAAATLLIATPDPQALLHDWPALARRLAVADYSREDFLALEDWLLSLHDIPADAEPALAASAAGLGGRGHGWLRIDALSLAISRDRLVALPQRAQDAGDAATLIDATLKLLLTSGALHPDGSRRLLDLDAPPEARFAPAWRTAGRPLDDHLPQGPRGAEWRRWLTEAQMLLHEHPVNADREARGLRPLNALWLSGGAALAPPPRDCAVRLLGRHPFMATLPVSAPAGLGTPGITVWLHEPGQRPPAPVVALLRAHGLRLRVLEPSGQQCYTRQPWHALRVWRKPLRTLTAQSP